MSSSFKVGDQISFYGGTGNVVDIRGGTLQVLTEDGSIQQISPNQPMVRKVGEAEQGDYVEFPGGRAHVISTQERPGRPDLLYLRTEDNELKKVPADMAGVNHGYSIPDRIEAGEFDDPVRFSLRERAVRLSLAYRSDRFLSLSGNRIRIEPYQVDAAHQILTAYEPRYMIADEVGLGKTIEAGIVIEELIARDRADRVLIVTPASLRDQWQREMKDKFGREYVAYDRGYVDGLRSAHRAKNVWMHEDKIVVSIDFAKQDDMLESLRELDDWWDVVVFDEAHHLTARETSDGIDRVSRYRVAEAVAQDTDALLFLTGTPHKGKPDQFFHLLRLLDPYRFRSPEDITPTKLEDLMIRRVKTDESMIAADGTPMFPDREITTLPVGLTPAERRLYEDLTEYISAVYSASADSDRYAAGFTMVIYQKRLVSSIRAIAQSLQNRLDDLEQKTTVPGNISSRLNTVDHTVDTEADVLEQLIDAANDIDVDSKGERLREFVDGVLAEDPDEKILLFTEYTDTLEYLRDDVLSNYSTVEISGSLDQDSRREAIEEFRSRASILLATDAAREGLNLQFAHIMVNYDLPWNPIRIDQRMGRLHRYGQDETVQVYNLFVEDTRESDILQLLIDKLDQIEEDMGMRSDVLGTVLEDYDVESAIMDAVTGHRSSNEVKRDIETAVEERKEAVKQIEQEFLIRDKFDAEDHAAIEELIDLSEEKPIGEDDIEQLVREFCTEFGGSISTGRTAVESQSALLEIEVPDIISMNSDADSQYWDATFSRKVALEEPAAELISLNHPLVQAITEYCLDGDWIDGKAAVLVAQDPSRAPGILATFRLGYISGEGDVATEDYTHVYMDAEGAIHEEAPAIVGAVPPDTADALREYELPQDAGEVFEIAADRAEEFVFELVEVVEAERAKEVEIKEQHAERYFQHQIREQEERLRKYEKDDVDTEKDMKVAIDTTRAEIRKLEDRWEEEQARLERERQIVPDEPELVNAALVTDQLPALHGQGDQNEVASGSTVASFNSRVVFVPSHAALANVAELADGARLLRPAKWGTQLEGLTATSIDGTAILTETSLEELDHGRDGFAGYARELEERLEEFDAGLDVGLCLSDKPVDAVVDGGTVFCNLALWDEVTGEYWRAVLARESVYANSNISAERRYEQIQRLLE